MSRRLRFIPEGGTLIEVTCRTVQGRHLRQAAEKLKAGDRGAAFPIGSFPPALPFVGG